jgi:hypothetical protein
LPLAGGYSAARGSLSEPSSQGDRGTGSISVDLVRLVNWSAREVKGTHRFVRWMNQNVRELSMVGPLVRWMNQGRAARG